METIVAVIGAIFLGALVVALIQALGVPEASFSARGFGREMCKYLLAGLAIFAIIVSLWAMWAAGVAVWVMFVLVLGLALLIAAIILWQKPAKTTVTINETKKVVRIRRVKPAPVTTEPAPASTAPAAASQEETASEKKE